MSNRRRDGEVPVEVRPAEAADRPAMDRVKARAQPRNALQRDWVRPTASPVTPPHQLVAVVDGELVGVAGHSKPGGRRLVAMVDVDPDWRRRGIGTALAEALAPRLATTGHPEAIVSVDDHDGDSVRFATRWGAEPGPATCTMYELDLTAGFPPATELPATTEGFEVRRLADADLANDTLLDALHALHVASESEPYLATGTTLERDEWVAAAAKRIDGDGVVVVALRDGAPVAYAEATLLVHVPLARTGLTYVRPEVRGIGLGRAVKAETCRWAADAGLTALISEVHEENAAIHATNRSLGFRPLPSSRWTVRLG